jgi:vacuolar iron transporter family protein
MKLRITFNTLRTIAAQRRVVTSLLAWQSVAMPIRTPRTHSESAHVPGGRSLRDLVFGMNDGLVAAFAVCSGVHGAAASGKVVLLAGLAELIGGTIAMGLGAWLAAKSDHEFIASERAREEREVREFPEEERREVREAYSAQGFEGAALEAIVGHVTAEPRRWVDTMMREELGLPTQPEGSAVRAGTLTGLAYALGAAFPVLPYALPVAPGPAFAGSIALTLLALFAAGAAKTKVTGRPLFRSGLEALAIGTLAAACTFAAGKLVGS